MQSSAHLNSPCASCIFTRWSVTRILTCFGQQGIRRWKKKRSASEIKQSNCVHPRKLTELKWYCVGSRWNASRQPNKLYLQHVNLRNPFLKDYYCLWRWSINKNLWNQWDVDYSIAKGELLQWLWWLQSSNIHRDLHGEKPPCMVMPRQEAREVVRDVLEAIALKDTPMDLKGPDFGGWNGLELEWS